MRDSQTITLPTMTRTDWSVGEWRCVYLEGMAQSVRLPGQKKMPLWSASN